MTEAKRDGGAATAQASPRRPRPRHGHGARPGTGGTGGGGSAPALVFDPALVAQAGWSLRAEVVRSSQS
jgi:hypothetical protein